jgi:hypothetical protein
VDSLFSALAQLDTPPAATTPATTPATTTPVEQGGWATAADWSAATAAWALLAQVENSVAAATAAPAAPAAPKAARWARNPGAGTVGQLAALIAAAGGGDTVVLDAALLAAHNIAATWLKNTPAFTQADGVRNVAALQCGYKVAAFKRGVAITLVRVAA